MLRCARDDTQLAATADRDARVSSRAASKVCVQLCKSDAPFAAFGYRTEREALTTTPSPFTAPASGLLPDGSLGTLSERFVAGAYRTVLGRALSLGEQLGGALASHAAYVNRFLDRLEVVAKAAKDPALTGVVAPKWGSVGATVSEVLKHLEKFRLTVAPAPTGSEEAYFALHRGLVGYYAALSQGKP